MVDERVAALSQRYSEHAQAYRELWAPILHVPARKLLAALAAIDAERDVAPHSVRRVMDVGSGVGTLLPDLRSTFPRSNVLGVDRAHGMLALAPRDGPLCVMDAAQTAIASRCLDVVTFVFVLFHLPDPRQALMEARRVLRASGSIATLTWGSDLESAATRIWNEELDAHGAPPLDAETELAQHELVDTPDKVAALLESVGFVSIQTWMEPHEYTIPQQHLIELRTRMGRNKGRFDGLDAQSQVACLASANRRMAPLPTAAFVCRSELVYALARTPATDAPDTSRQA